MNQSDLLEMFKDYCNEEMKEFVELVNEFIEDVRDDKYIDKLQDKLVEICEESNVCPICGSYLISNKNSERSEFLGMPVDEEIIYKVCSQCGEI